LIWVDTILRGLGIAERFRAVVGGTDVPCGKPPPDVYLRAAEELGFAPAQCAAIEDSATGVIAAKAAGLRAIVVPNRYTALQDLSRADAQVRSLEQVMGLLDWQDLEGLYRFRHQIVLNRLCNLHTYKLARR